MASEKQEIQPGQPVKFIVQCMRYKGEYLGDHENGQALVQTKKYGVLRVDKSILRSNEPVTQELHKSLQPNNERTVQNG